MAGHLQDLFEHQAWADAELWRAILAHPAAREDAAIVARLHHIHLVQHAFLCIIGGEPFTPTSTEDFPTLTALANYAREGHLLASAVLSTVDDQRAAASVDIPWFRNPPVTLTVGQALLQAAMHSHYHRGQNATRLRELGGEPPLTDLIVWYWKQKPTPKWE